MAGQVTQPRTGRPGPLGSNFPAEHMAHAVPPARGLTAPAGHDSHAREPAPGAKVLGGHRAQVRFGSADGLNLPGWQAVQGSGKWPES